MKPAKKARQETKQSEKKSGQDKIAADVWSRILRDFLGPADQYSLCRTCKSFELLLRKWVIIGRDWPFEMRMELERFLSRLKSLETLEVEDVSDGRVASSIADWIAHSARRLKAVAIQVTDPTFATSFWTMLWGVCRMPKNRLHELNINAWDMDLGAAKTTILGDIVRRHPNSLRLWLVADTATLYFPNNKSWRRRLSILMMTTPVTDALLLEISKDCPTLRELELDYSAGEAYNTWTQTGFRAVTRNPKLTNLELSLNVQKSRWIRTSLHWIQLPSGWMTLAHVGRLKKEKKKHEDKNWKQQLACFLTVHDPPKWSSISLVVQSVAEFIELFTCGSAAIVQSLQLKCRSADLIDPQLIHKFVKDFGCTNFRIVYGNGSVQSANGQQITVDDSLMRKDPDATAAWQLQFA